MKNVINKKLIRKQTQKDNGLLMIYWFGISQMTAYNFCFYLQNRLMQISQRGGQWYSDTSPFSIP
jgi:hypothetical protein